MPGKTPVRELGHRISVTGFNEAPAKCRGKLDNVLSGRGSFPRFNEAPAKCRGKPAKPTANFLSAKSASMRPQRNAGENALPAACSAIRRTSFNEAPAKCRGKPAPFRHRFSS